MIRCFAIVASLYSCGVLPAQQPGPRQPQVFPVSGIVVKEGTTQPLKRVQVAIFRNDHPDQAASLMTAADGRFTFTGVPSGKYTLMAEWHGMQTAFHNNEFFSTGIVVGSGLDSTHIVFPFPPSATLQVQVSDEEGEPVRNAQVWLFHKKIASGYSRIELAGQMNTATEGTARFAHLEPGTYYVAAGGRPWYSQNQPILPDRQEDASQSNLDVAYAITYNGGSQDPEAATPVDLSDGQIGDVKISLRAVPAVHIPIPGGSETQAFSGNVQAIGPGGIRMWTSSFVMSNGTQREISGLAPGSYVLSLSAPVRADSLPENVESMRVTAASSASASLSEMQKTSVSGMAALEEGKWPLPAAGLTLVNSTNSENAFCPFDQQGSFRCSGIVSGASYEVRLTDPSEMYIKSLHATGAKFESGLLTVPAGQSAELAIVLAKGRSNVDGVALKGGQPFAGAMVLLIPQDLALGLDIPRDQSDSDGTFTLQNAPPGRYYLLALDNGKSFEYRNKEILRPYLAQARAVEVPLPSKGALQVEVQPRKR